MQTQEQRVAFISVLLHCSRWGIKTPCALCSSLQEKCIVCTLEYTHLFSVQFMPSRPRYNFAAFKWKNIFQRCCCSTHRCCTQSDYVLCCVCICWSGGALPVCQISALTACLRGAPCDNEVRLRRHSPRALCWCINFCATRFADGWKCDRLAYLFSGIFCFVQLSYFCIIFHEKSSFYLQHAARINDNYFEKVCLFAFICRSKNLLLSAQA